MPDCSAILKRVSRTPARDRALPLLPEAIAEGWTVREFAEKASISRGLASVLMKEASMEQKRRSDRELSNGLSRALEIAERVRDQQVEEANRIDALTERALDDLEAQATRGELSIRDLEMLLRLRDRHWQHVKDIAGIHLAEKIAVSNSKCGSRGGQSAAELVDATSLVLGESVWLVDDD
ncbi:MAG: hypothetical protein P1U86_22885 [Verrucomicrobiales bacterium]|nr:hypothetical protein [Verrucomicrobiales bacterium]